MFLKNKNKPLSTVETGTDVSVLIRIHEHFYSIININSIKIQIIIRY